MLTVLGLAIGIVGGACASPLRIVVSVLPLKTFVERVGGDRVHVDVMVPPGRSPATYDPSPRQVASLADADLYVRVGAPFENAWMRRFQSASPTLAVLDVRDGMTLRPMAAHHHARHGEDAEPAEHAHPGGSGAAMDSHIWTSPRLVRTISRSIAERLADLDPNHADDYAANQRTFDAELVALDAWLTERLADLDDRRFLVFHPAWGYFAADYALEQVPIEHEGKPPGARRLAALIDQAQNAGIRVVFVQPQFDHRAAEQLARAIGGKVVAIDPLSADYIANLRRVADALVAAGPHTGDAPRSAERR
jgi:zinc transport system substrate-binding protein